MASKKKKGHQEPQYNKNVKFRLDGVVKSRKFWRFLVLNQEQAEGYGPLVSWPEKHPHLSLEIASFDLTGHTVAYLSAPAGDNVSWSAMARMASAYQRAHPGFMGIVIVEFKAMADDKRTVICRFGLAIIPLHLMKGIPVFYFKKRNFPNEAGGWGAFETPPAQPLPVSRPLPVGTTGCSLKSAASPDSEIEHVDWTVLPPDLNPNDSLLWGKRKGIRPAQPGSKKAQQKERIDFLHSLPGRKRWVIGKALGGRWYIVAVFEKYIFAESDMYGNALYYVVADEEEEWKSVISCKKPEARARGACKIDHRGGDLWKEQVTALSR